MEQNLRNGNQNVWTWLWSKRSPSTVAAGLGTSHSTDSVFWLGTITSAAEGIGGVGLSERMASYWINFANTQNPNGNGNGGVPPWPRYNEGGQARMLNLDGDLLGYTISTIKDDFRQAGIQFINDNADTFNLSR
jgi:carboxylesterase type B